MAPESGNPMIVPICAPLKLNIASLLLSKGGAQAPHIASIAGNVTPYYNATQMNYYPYCMYKQSQFNKWSSREYLHHSTA